MVQQGGCREAVFSRERLCRATCTLSPASAGGVLLRVLVGGCWSGFGFWGWSWEVLCVGGFQSADGRRWAYM